MRKITAMLGAAILMAAVIVTVRSPAARAAAPLRAEKPSQPGSARGRLLAGRSRPARTKSQERCRGRSADFQDGPLGSSAGD